MSLRGDGVSSYAGCHNHVEAPIDVDNRGVLFLNSRVSKAEITDGTSFTIFVGEKTLKRPDSGWMSGTRATLRNTGTRLNAKRAPGANGGVGADPNDHGALFVGGFSSAHPGGANFIFGDGSVRFITESINPAVYRLLGHRADGELISDVTL